MTHKRKVSLVVDYDSETGELSATSSKYGPKTQVYKTKRRGEVAAFARELTMLLLSDFANWTFEDVCSALANNPS